MTYAEFLDLRKMLTNLVGGFPEWLARGRTDDDQKSLLTTWAIALQDVAISDAKAAVQAIVKGDIDKPAYGDLPAAIRKHARSLASKRYSGGTGSRRTIDGHELIDCPECEDSGYVTCYHPRTIDEYRSKGAEAFLIVPIRGGGERRTMPNLYTCAPVCFCSAGLVHHRPGVNVYDDIHWIRKTAISIECQIAELIAGINERLQAALESKPNYTGEFARWNQGME